RSVGAGIEVEDNLLFAFERSEIDGFSVAGRKNKFWSGFSGGDDAHVAPTGTEVSTPAISRRTDSCDAFSRGTSPTILPWRMTMIRVERFNTSGNSEEINMIATPCRARSSISS